MRPIFTLLILFIAIICFFAGYTVGTKHGYRSALLSSVEQKAAPPDTTAEAASPQTSAHEAPDSSAQEPIAAEPSSVPAAPQPTVADRFALRAQQNTIRLTDTQDRILIGELIEASAQNLQVKRQVDGRIVNVPTHMLCSEDQEFAAYLFEEQQAQTSSSNDDEINWDELFQDM